MNIGRGVDKRKNEVRSESKQKKYFKSNKDQKTRTTKEKHEKKFKKQKKTSFCVLKNLKKNTKKNRIIAN